MKIIYIYNFINKSIIFNYEDNNAGFSANENISEDVWSLTIIFK